MMRAVGLAVAVLLLTSCGDSGGSAEGPSTASTRTPGALPSPTATIPNSTRTPEREETTRTPEREETTRTPEREETTSPTETEPEPAPTRSGPVAAASPTDTTEPEPTRTESSQPTETTTTTETAPTETITTTQSAPTASPAPTTSASVQPTATETDGAPTWLWWLLGALAVALAVAIPLMVRAGHRREWREDLAADEDEVAWFARGLIPDLRGLGSLAEVAGGWSLAESRVAAVEDRLTALEPSAPDEEARLRALDLRDAVRTARAQMQTLLEAGQAETMTQDLDAVAAGLEQVLGPPPPPPPIE